MTRTSVSEAGENLQAIIDQASRNNDPVLITGNGFNAVLLGEEVWIGIQETLSLLSISGMRQSILAGMATPLEECGQELGW